MLTEGVICRRNTLQRFRTIIIHGCSYKIKVLNIFLQVHTAYYFCCNMYGFVNNFFIITISVHTRPNSVAVLYCLKQQMVPFSKHKPIVPQPLNVCSNSIMSRSHVLTPGSKLCKCIA